jgi:hypothetical protein
MTDQDELDGRIALFGLLLVLSLLVASFHVLA